jgi:hypothetical protein
MSELSHFDDQGRARMVDVGAKPETERVAVASGRVLMAPETAARIAAGTIGKGDVLGVARIAGIQGLKRTAELVPLCHPIRVTGVALDLAVPFARDGHRLVAGPFPEPLRRAREVYLLILRPFDERVSLDEVKLASPGRLELVHRHALTGVAFQKVTAPGFMHTFGVNADFYLLEQGDEWAHAAREGALCLFDRPQLAHVSAALTWRI